MEYRGGLDPENQGHSGICPDIEALFLTLKCTQETNLEIPFLLYLKKEDKKVYATIFIH